MARYHPVPKHCTVNGGLKRLNKHSPNIRTCLLVYVDHDFSEVKSGKTRGGVTDDTKTTFDVPHGSALGPLLFVFYTAPIGDIIGQYLLNYHMYADDTKRRFIDCKCTLM